MAAVRGCLFCSLYCLLISVTVITYISSSFILRFHLLAYKALYARAIKSCGKSPLMEVPPYFHNQNT